MGEKIKAKEVKTPKLEKPGVDSPQTQNVEKKERKRKATDSDISTPVKLHKAEKSKVMTPKTPKTPKTHSTPKDKSQVKEQISSDSPQKKKKNKGKNKKGKFTTLFLGGLDNKVPREAITEFFSNHNIKLYEVRKKGGRRYGHVDLVDADDLQKALSLNGKKLAGNKVTIQAVTKHIDTKVMEVKSQTLFVKNIDATVTKDALRDIFPNAVSIKYPKTHSGTNKGFAFIKMASIEAVKEYLQKKNLELKGQKLKLDTVETGTRNTNILRVRNLNFETTKETLEDIFKGCKSVKLCLNNAGKSLGTAIITYETIEEAKEAKSNKHKTQVDGRDILVSCITAEDKPIVINKKKFGKSDRYGRKKSSVYEKKRKPQNIIKKTTGNKKK